MLWDLKKSYSREKLLLHFKAFSLMWSGIEHRLPSPQAAAFSHSLRADTVKKKQQFCGNSEKNPLVISSSYIHVALKCMDTYAMALHLLLYALHLKSL